MGEMDLGRACDILNREWHEGGNWGTDHAGVVRHDDYGNQRRLTEFEAVAVAERYERDARAEAVRLWDAIPRDDAGHSDPHPTPTKEV